MSKEPARLGKRVDPQPINFANLMMLHPAVVAVGIGVTLIIIIMLISFSLTGNSAVESGAMRNFIASGV